MVDRTGEVWIWTDDQSICSTDFLTCLIVQSTRANRHVVLVFEDGLLEDFYEWDSRPWPNKAMSLFVTRLAAAERFDPAITGCMGRKLI